MSAKTIWPIRQLRADFHAGHISKAEAHLADTIADLLVESGKYPHREWQPLHSSWLGRSSCCAEARIPPARGPPAAVCLGRAVGGVLDAPVTAPDHAAARARQPDRS